MIGISVSDKIELTMFTNDSVIISESTVLRIVKKYSRAFETEKYLNKWKLQASAYKMQYIRYTWKNKK